MAARPVRSAWRSVSLPWRGKTPKWKQPEAQPLLQRIKQSLAFDALVCGDRSHDGVKRAHPERIVIGNRQPLVAGGFGLQNDVAADLMKLAIAPVAAQHADQLRAA